MSAPYKPRTAPFPTRNWQESLREATRIDRIELEASIAEAATATVDWYADTGMASQAALRCLTEDAKARQLLIAAGLRVCQRPHNLEYLGRLRATVREAARRGQDDEL